MYDNFIIAIASIIGSGAFAAWIAAFMTRKKTAAEVGKTQVDTVLAIDARLSEKIEQLNTRISFLEAENIKLHAENLKLKEELHALQKTAP